MKKIIYLGAGLLMMFGFIGNVNAGCEYSKQMTITTEVQGNVITWATILEVTNEKFVIQKSYDGVNFESLDELEGAGTSRESNIYFYFDQDLTVTTIVYRLKQVDTNGKENLLAPKKFNRTESPMEAFAALSKPTIENSIQFDLTGTKSGFVSIELTNKETGEVITKDYMLREGQTELKVDVADLGVANYEVALDIDGKTEIFAIEKTGFSLSPPDEMADTKVKFKKVKKNNK